MAKNQTLLRATRVRKLWRAINTLIVKGHGISKKNIVFLPKKDSQKCTHK